jgi:ABC-type antimicrobial peptide transport system permease subunit
MSDALEALFEELEETADKAVRLGRVVGFLSALRTALVTSVALAVVAYLVYHEWHFAVAGVVLATVSLVTHRLHGHYRREMLTAVDRVKGLARMLSLASRLDQLAEVEDVEHVLEIMQN